MYADGDFLWWDSVGGVICFRCCEWVLLGLSLLNGHGYSGGQREVSFCAAIVVEGGGMDGRKWVGLCKKGGKEGDRYTYQDTSPWLPPSHCKSVDRGAWSRPTRRLRRRRRLSNIYKSASISPPNPPTLLQFPPATKPPLPHPTNSTTTISIGTQKKRDKKKHTFVILYRFPSSVPGPSYANGSGPVNSWYEDGAATM